MQAKYSKIIWKYIDITYYRMSRIHASWYVLSFILFIVVYGTSINDRYTQGASFVGDYGPVNMDD